MSVITVRDKSCDGAHRRNRGTRAPLSWDLRDFPRRALRRRGLPLRWERQLNRASLSRSSSPSRSFCLRVSGAVAPSAPSSAIDAKDLSREGSCVGQDRGASRRTAMLQRIIKGGGRRVNESAGSAWSYSHSLRELRCPEGPESWSRPSKTRAQSPRRAARECRVRFGQDVVLGIEAAEILRQRRRRSRTACWARACLRPPPSRRAATEAAATSVRSSGERMAGAPIAWPSLARLAQDRLDAHRGILQIGPGLALEFARSAPDRRCNRWCGGWRDRRI